MAMAGLSSGILEFSVIFGSLDVRRRMLVVRCLHCSPCPESWQSQTNGPLLGHFCRFRRPNSALFCRLAPQPSGERRRKAAKGGERRRKAAKKAAHPRRPQNPHSSGRRYFRSAVPRHRQASGSERKRAQATNCANITFPVNPTYRRCVRIIRTFRPWSRRSLGACGSY